MFDYISRSTSYHRRSVSCVASHDELSYFPIEVVEEEEEDATAISTGNISSGSPSVHQADGTMARSLSSNSSDSADSVVSTTGSLGGKIKPAAPGPRRSLLSDMLNSQNQNNRLEQTAHRRRMLKSMRRYSVDASEMNFNIYPSGRASSMKGIPSEAEEAAAAAGGGPRTAQEFRDTPTVRYLRNPSHATVKTKLIQGTIRRGDDNEAPDYFGGEDRVW
ncbi:hypothetical protein BGX21_008110 [Mortierella sp. AD011]|nr:hypothetical protein BGX20_008736 [Mortierella sp. AD010]KAF9402917.1 hypothetical protein BGX21_008110 [Mortierella sp. AD011]